VGVRHHAGRIKRTVIDPAQAQARRAEAIPAKSIAVLPFENLSDDPENAYFDGVHDDILSSSEDIDLKVISRTSVRQYRKARNLREILGRSGSRIFGRNCDAPAIACG
jgi:TolB-like protein